MNNIKNIDTTEKKFKIILIGMPGCGKTTLGRLAAEKLKYEFVDLDEMIVDVKNKSINQIFEEDGEDCFRQLETDVLEDTLGINNKNMVISTGGGIVKLDRNTELMKKSECTVIFIDRPLDNIIGDVDTSGRPLLKDGADRLKKLYSERYNLYVAAAEYKIENDAEIEVVLNRLCNIVLNK